MNFKETIGKVVERVKLWSEKNFAKQETLDQIVMMSENLFDPNDPDAFYGRIGGSGATIEDDTLFTTGFIKANSGETIYSTRKHLTTLERIPQYFVYLYTYDSEKNRINLHTTSSTTLDTGSFTITDENVTYIRITIKTQFIVEETEPMLAKNPNAEYSPYGEASIKEDVLRSGVEKIHNELLENIRISQEQAEFVLDSVNLFDKASELNQNNYTLNAAESVDGQTTRDDDQFITHPISVKNGDVVRLNTDFNYIYCFKEDGTYTRGYYLSQYPDRIITIDRDTVSQMRVSFIKSAIDPNWIQTCMITVNNEMPDEYQEFGVTMLENDIDLNGTQKESVTNIIHSVVGSGGDILNGKTIAAAGDSITYGLRAEVDAETGWYKNYAALVALRHGMTYYNYGVSGSTLSNVNEKSFCVTRYQEMADDLDYLTIWFGWNDFAYSTLGTIDDTEDTTFYGAWNKVLPYLINKYPTTKIGLVVPYGINADWRNAVRLVAKKYGLPYLDLMSEHTPLFYEKEHAVDASVVALRKSTFLADGTHPNQVGYDYLSTIYENWLKSL